LTYFKYLVFCAKISTEYGADILPFLPMPRTTLEQLRHNVIDEFEEADLERCGYPPPVDVLAMMEHVGNCPSGLDRMLAVIDRVEADTAVMLYGESARRKAYRLVS
jgi:hypothetical protein